MGDGKPGPITMQLLAAWSEAGPASMSSIRAMQLSGRKLKAILLSYDAAWMGHMRFACTGLLHTESFEYPI